MSIATENAAELFTLASKAAERGNVNEALRYSEKAQDLLLRPSSEIEAPKRRENIECLNQIFAQ